MTDKELHSFFDDVKLSLTERTQKLENDKLNNEEKIYINYEFIKQLTLRLITLIKSILYQPVNFVLKTAKREMKIFGLISFVLVFMFIIFVVGWFFFAVLVASYFYESGNSLTFSVLFSLLIQILVMIIVGIIGFIAYKKSVIKTLIDFAKKKKP